MKNRDLNLIRYFSLVVSILILALGIPENLITQMYYDPLILRVVLSSLGISYFFTSTKVNFVKKYAVFFFYIIDHLVFLWLIYLCAENSFPDRYTNSIYVATILNSFLFIKSRHLVFFNSYLLFVWFAGLYFTYGSFDINDNKTFLILITASSTIGFFFIRSRNKLRSTLEELEEENKKRIKVEEELKEKSQGLEAILNANPDLIFIQNTEGVYLNYFTENLDLLLVNPSDFINKNMKDVLPEMLYNIINKAFERVAKTGRSENISYYTPSENNSLRYWEARLNKYSSDKVITIIRDVTTVEKQKQNIISQNRFIEQVTNASPNKILVVDIKERIISFSNSTNILGHNFNSLLFDDKKIRSLILDEDYNSTLKSYHQLLSKEIEDINLELRLINDDFSIYWIELNAKIFSYDEGNNVKEILLLINDINERKEKEKELSKIEARWQFALESSGDGVWDWNLDTNEVYFSKQWKAMLGFEDHEIQDSLEEWNKRVHPDDIKKTYEDINSHIEGKTDVYVNEHRVICKDGSYKWVLDRGKVIEYNQDGKPLRMIGTHSDLDERIAKEKEIKELEQIWYFALEGVGDGIWDWNLVDGSVVYSTKWKALIGYDDHEIKNDFSEWTRLVHPDDQEQANQKVGDYLQKKTDRYEAEFRMKTKSGNWKWIQARGKALKVDKAGNPTRIIGTHTDIDDRKNAIKKIEDTNLRFEKLINSIPGLFWIKDITNNKILYISNNYEKIWGSSIERIMKDPEDFLKPIHPEDIQRIFEEYQKIFEGNTFNEEYRLIVNDKIKLVNARTELVKDENGNLFDYGYAEDITERYEYEKQLIEKSEELYLAQQMAKVGGWRVDLNANKLIWSEEVKRIHEVDLDYQPDLETAINFYIPEHRDKISKAIEEAIKNGNSWDLELKINTANDNVKWVRTIGRAVFDDNNDAIELNGTIQDIDKQKQLQEERNKFFDLSLDLIAVAGFDGYFKQINNTWTQVLGWSETELLSKPYLDFVHPDDLESTVNAADGLEENNPVISFTNRYQAKDGTYKWLAWNSLPDLEYNVVFAIARDVTKEKEQQLKLMEVANQMQMAQDMAKIGAWSVDLKTNMPQWSDKVREIHEMPEGYEPDLETAINFYIPDHRPRVQNYVQEAITNGNEWDFELQIETGKENIKWVRSIGKAIYDENGDPVKLTGTIQDIDDQKRAYEEKNKIFNISVDMICIANFQGYFTQVNQAWNTHLGWSEAEMLEKPFMTFLHPDDVEVTNLALGSLADGHNLVSFENRFADLFGNYRWLSWNAIASPADGLLYAIARDVTDEKKKTAELEKAKLDAETANKTKSNFLANMSHEIRTPMNAIIGFSSLLQDTIKDSESQGYINSIINSGKSLLTLINDILDLSKIEAGKLDIKYEHFNVENLLKEIVRIFKLKADEKSILLDFKVEPDFPKIFNIDGVRLRQILFNLVGNAIKFTDEGSVIIKADYDQSEQSLTLKVIDSGIGIPDDQQDKIFQAFRQQEEQSTRKYGGTGLGLTITKQLTEMMDGDISLISTKGEGSTFTVKLNNIEVIDSSLNNINKRFGATRYFDIKTILIVEDNDVNFDLLKYILEKITNAEIIWAQNGKVGIEKFKEHNPDIVLMDIHMPVMDGLEATVNIRDLKNGAETPIIAVTAAAMKEDVEANELIFENYLVKPITKNDVIQIFSNYFKYEESIEDVPSEVIISDKELSSESIGLINDSLSDKIKTNKSAFDMDIAGNLVDALIELANEKNNDEILHFANELKSYIDNFDIDGFEQKLALFP